MSKLGSWGWYAGIDDTDDEMIGPSNREQAILDGRQNFDGQFYLVEARMLVVHEQSLGCGTRETAPFAETRNGEWIKA